MLQRRVSFSLEKHWSIAYDNKNTTHHLEVIFTIRKYLFFINLFDSIHVIHMSCTAINILPIEMMFFFFIPSFFHNCNIHTFKHFRNYSA